MMKTRLTKELRHHLLSLANQRVKAPEIEGDYDKARALAEKEVLRCIRTAYPPKEMKVLHKHGVASRINWWRVVLNTTDGKEVNRWSQWDFRDSRGQPRLLTDEGGLPYTPVGLQRINLDGPASDAVAKAEAMLTKRDEARRAILQDIYTLVRQARNMEEVEDVWPAAKECRQYVRTVPVVILAPVIDRIKVAVGEKLA